MHESVIPAKPACEASRLDERSEAEPDIKPAFVGFCMHPKNLSTTNATGVTSIWAPFCIAKYALFGIFQTFGAQPWTKTWQQVTFWRKTSIKMGVDAICRPFCTLEMTKGQNVDNCDKYGRYLTISPVLNDDVESKMLLFEEISSYVCITLSSCTWPHV